MRPLHSGQRSHSSPRVREKERSLIGKTNISCGQLFLKPNSIASSQTIPDESVTFIAVEEDIHQNITSSVVLKKGIEELWCEKKSGKIHQLVGMHRDHGQEQQEAGNNAFRKSRSQELQSRGHVGRLVQGEHLSNVLTCWSRTKCHVESCTKELQGHSPMLPWLVEHAGCICPGARRVVTVGRHSDDCMARSLHQNLYPSERRCWQDQNLQKQNESQVQVRSVDGCEKQQC